LFRFREVGVSESEELSRQSMPAPQQAGAADLQRREALIKLGKYTAYATPVLLATVTAAQAASAPTPAPPIESDARLKMNIAPVAVLSNGIALYSYQFRRDPTTTYVGVLAQDLLTSEKREFRDAVVVGAGGYYAVNYETLGLRMVTADEWHAASVQISA
jgi:hypothetical protein